MRIAMSLRNLSLGVATASFLLAGSAMAQPSSPSSNGSSAQMQQWQLKGVNARLDHSVDAQSAHDGQVIGMKLDHKVKEPDGTTLPAGTQVWGKVENVQASQNGGPSSLTLRFTKAVVRGKTVPVKVTVIGAYPMNAEGSYVNSMGGELPPAPQHISSRDRYKQEPGVLHHIAMQSSVQGHNSAKFTEQDGNVRLNRGTYLQVAIAEMNQNGGHGSSMQRSGM